MSTEHRCETWGQIAPDWAGITVDPVMRTIMREGMAAHLTGKEFAVFAALYRAPGKVLAQERIHTLMYGNDINGGPDIKILRVLVCRMRKKLLAGGGAIVTGWGTGFSLTVEPFA